MKNEKALNVEIKEVLKIIKRRIYIVLAATVLMTSLALFYSIRHNATPLYQTKCNIIIGNSLDSEGTQFKIEDVQRIQAFMGTYSTLVKTTVVAETTIKRLNLNISPDAFKTLITPIPQPDTQFMELRFTWTNPEEAVTILNTLAQVFIEQSKEIYPAFNMKVMEPAKEAYPLSYSSRKKYIILGFAAGIILSLLIIFGLEFLDNTLKTEEDVEELLNIPVIGTIPKSKKQITEISQEYIEKLSGGILESYRTLRTNIYFSSVYKDVKSIVVTSGSPGEGKSTTSSMLASIIAQAGKKTLLIDCDMRNPNIHRLFNYSNLKGLSNVLVGECTWTEVLSANKINNLFVVTAGIKPPNPAEILSSTKMKDLIEELKKEFQYIILDTPPVGVITDAQILSQFTDGCLLVVASGSADRKQTEKAKDLIEYVNGRILGVLLNKIRDTEVYKYYNHYYEKD